MIKVGEHITLDIIGTAKEYDPSVFEKVITEIKKKTNNKIKVLANDIKIDDCEIFRYKNIKIIKTDININAENLLK